MSMQSEGKDAQGRNWQQATRDGSGSVGSVGPGGTGDIGRMAGDAGPETAGNARDGGPGNAQSDARTDDWLTSGTEREQRQGFRPSDPDALETGLEGIAGAGGNAGNRQSAGPGENIGGESGGQHKDWGHSPVDTISTFQSGVGVRAGVDAGRKIDAALAQDAGSGKLPAAAGGNIGGESGGQHKDWGHSPVADAGNRQSAADPSAVPRAPRVPRQGVMPGEEMGHLHPRGKGNGGKKKR